MGYRVFALGIRNKLLTGGMLLASALMSTMQAVADVTPLTGRAVIYNDKMHGKPVVAKGEHYDKNALTAATHKHFAIGSTVKVTNLSNKKSVTLKVNDRMNSKSKAIIDVSRKAAEELDMVREGHVKVRVEQVK